MEQSARPYTITFEKFAGVPVDAIATDDLTYLERRATDRKTLAALRTELSARHKKARAHARWSRPPQRRFEILL